MNTGNSALPEPAAGERASASGVKGVLLGRRGSDLSVPGVPAADYRGNHTVPGQSRCMKPRQPPWPNAYNCSYPIVVPSRLIPGSEMAAGERLGPP